MKILVASVHHTGTKTIFNDLLRDYTEVNQQDKEWPSAGKIRIHIDKAFLEDLEYWLERAITIVPIRHPRSVAIGWKSRFKPFWDLAEQWRLLKTVVDKYEPYYLPIDRDDRDDWLDDFNKRNKLKLTTTWPRLGQHGGEYAELNGSEELLVKSWMCDGFFERFGYGS